MPETPTICVGGPYGGGRNINRDHAADLAWRLRAAVGLHEKGAALDGALEKIHSFA